MKHLIKKFIKMLYVVIVPILALTSGIGYFVAICICILVLLAIVNAIFFTVFMEKVVILPKFNIAAAPCFGFGIAWGENGEIHLLLPFSVVEIKFNKPL